MCPQRRKGMVVKMRLLGSHWSGFEFLLCLPTSWSSASWRTSLILRNKTYFWLLVWRPEMMHVKCQHSEYDGQGRGLGYEPRFTSQTPMTEHQLDFSGHCVGQVLSLCLAVLVKGRRSWSFSRLCFECRAHYSFGGGRLQLSLDTDRWRNITSRLGPYIQPSPNARSPRAHSQRPWRWLSQGLSSFEGQFVSNKWSMGQLCELEQIFPISRSLYFYIYPLRMVIITCPIGAHSKNSKYHLLLLSLSVYDS